MVFSWFSKSKGKTHTIWDAAGAILAKGFCDLQYFNLLALYFKPTFQYVLFQTCHRFVLFSALHSKRFCFSNCTKLLRKKNKNSSCSFQAEKNSPAFQNAVCCTNRKVWWWHLSLGNKRSLFCVFCCSSCLVWCTNCLQFWPFCFLKSLKMQI